jgi:spore coat protein U-like protein
LKQLLVGAALVFSSLIATESFAQSSSNLDITAIVPDLCVVDVSTDTTMFFDLSGLAGAGADFTDESDFVTRCNRATFDISITSGQAGTYVRAMSADTVLTAPDLPYNLYTDSGYGTVWGDGSGTTSTVTENGAGIVTPVTTTIWGLLLLADAELAEPDSYTDQVTISILP